MPIPIFLVILILIIIYIKYRTSLLEKKHSNARKAFWEKETKANFTRKKDINTLDYIIINLDALPFHFNTNDETLKALQDKVVELSRLKMLDLRRYSNTDLKLNYGIANLEVLSAYENTYFELLRTLYKWSKHLNDIEFVQDSITVLEYGININTDISDHYILLGKLYKETHQFEALKHLIEKANQLDNLLKNKILSYLHE
ncbi:hypothetical protein EDC18_11315 [Natranaerovirga pectinivora]|uniref:Uncharacterized protein n=1 Tax=Natranaerovirga pectinivora TaxID=682400 RepID=A0A4R3MK64_9FIRM|nr:hypothetical protein [Natranaerovirga pectinivora]TCT12169.1 hypothetical protein EDC18_11315 [Natranaerovirga pectinivora]